MPETRVQSLGQEDPLEEEMATHSYILAWRIPWTEEPGDRKESFTTERLSLAYLPPRLLPLDAAMDSVLANIQSTWGLPRMLS